MKPTNMHLNNHFSVMRTQVMIQLGMNGLEMVNLFVVVYKWYSHACDVYHEYNMKKVLPLPYMCFGVQN